jgi:hypothetical protein
MPSPVGHLLGGAIVGFLVEPAAVLTVAVAGALPDIDFLWGRHNAETHSLGAAVLAGLAVLAWARWANLKVCPHPYRLALAVSLAWASHLLFDWLGSDDTPPLGVMALWPLNSTYYFAHAYVFEAISRRYWLSNFWSHNLYAVAKEILILGPVFVAIRAFRLRARRRFHHPGTE